MCFALCLLLGWMQARAWGQQAPADAASPTARAGAQQANGSLSGTVTDEDGDAVEKARVTLTGAGTAELAHTLSDGQGRFSFAQVAAGKFTLTVSAEGFGVATLSGAVQPGQAYEAPAIVLHAASQEHVEAVTQSELAEEQIKVEETQRLFGAVPNFFVTYNWHAQPLTSKQKFELAWKSTIDPVTFLVNGGAAGIEQAENALPGYGPGAAGYGKRYGAATGDNLVGTFVGGAILPSLFRQDPRYFYKGTGSIRSRALYALSTAVICRGDNGKWQPNYSGVLGDLAAGAASNLYYPASSRDGATLTFENGLISAALDGVGNLVQEFVFRKVTPGTHKNQTP